MTSEPKNAEAGYEKARTGETVLQRITAIRAPRILRRLELALILFALAVGIGAVAVVGR